MVDRLCAVSTVTTPLTKIYMQRTFAISFLAAKPAANIVDWSQSDVYSSMSAF